MAQYRTFKSLNLPEIDREIAAFWHEKEIFKKSIENRSEDNSFVFYEGPPSANGMPGIHHVMARTVKDLFCRFHTMKGKRVERKGGWDNAWTSCGIESGEGAWDYERRYRDQNFSR